jgi:hypothetical protein
MAGHTSSMEPLSARIPSDLYLWLAQLQVEGATTNSDKLRVLLGQLKRQHDGSLDHVAAHAWARDLTGRLRDALTRIEGQSGRHSEVMNLLLDHLVGSIALVMGASPANASEAARLEDALVRRAFSLTEGLLRQATTTQACAHDPKVVRRHLPTTLELAHTIHKLQGGHDG